MRKSPPKLIEEDPVSLRQQLVGPVNRVLFADPAEIQLHLSGQTESRRLPLEFVKTHQGQQGLYGAGIGKSIRSVKRPSSAQHAGGNIEQTLAQLITLIRKINQRRSFLIHLDRPAPISS